jgi:succinate dehydrogenase / fumarate reductase, cytochrome b subunit
LSRFLQEIRDIGAYRGGSGHWSYIFHRLTGIGVLVFLLIHILDTALIVLGPELYNKAIALYRHPVFRVSEIGLFAAVLYHALNGVRIILVDFWPNGTRHHRRMFWIEMALFVLIMVPVSAVMVRDMLFSAARAPAAGPLAPPEVPSPLEPGEPPR